MAVTLDKSTDTYQENGYVRYSNSQEDHTEAGLRFFWINSDKERTLDTTARDRGTILHGYFYNMGRGFEVDVQEDWAQHPISLFKEFQKRLSPYYLELPLVSPSLGLGCSIDYVGGVSRKDGAKDMIMDWKTGKKIYDSYSIQLAMYMAILYDYTGVLIEDLAVVQVPQEAGKKLKVEVVEDPWGKLYAGLLTFERWKRDNEKKLLWVRAPQQLIDVRSKLRGGSKKRIAFDNAEWRSWFAWPWLGKDSLVWWKETHNKLKGAQNGMERTETSTEEPRVNAIHQS